jgi:hypothetical protein
MTPRRVGGVVLIVIGVVLAALSIALIVLAYNLAHGGFGSAWPQPAYIPTATGLVGVGLVVAGVVMLIRAPAE